MKNPIITRVLSAVLSVLFCYGLSRMGLLGDNLNNQVITSALIYWTVPLALGIAVGGGVLVNLFRRATKLRRFIYPILAAIAISSVWQFSVSALLGPINGTFDSSVVFAWTGAVLLQLLFLQWRLPKEAEKPQFSVIIARILTIPVTVVVVLLAMNIGSLMLKQPSGSTKETFLIPADFKGEFRIVYGEKGGVKPKMEDGRRIYQIPENGVLVVQPQYKNETIDHEYYLVDKSGKRSEINMIREYKNRQAEAPGVLFWGSSILQDTAKISLTKFQPITYTEFTLYRKDTKERSNEEYIKFQEKFNLLTRSEVKKTREKLLK